MEDTKLLTYNRDLENAILDNRWIDLGRQNRLLDLFAVKNGYTLKKHIFWGQKRCKIHRRLKKFLTGQVASADWNKLTNQLGSKKHIKKETDVKYKKTKADLLREWTRDLEVYRQKQKKKLMVLRRL